MIIQKTTSMLVKTGFVQYAFKIFMMRFFNKKKSLIKKIHPGRIISPTENKKHPEQGCFLYPKIREQGNTNYEINNCRLYS
jgi:hypothetical protein